MKTLSGIILPSNTSGKAARHCTGVTRRPEKAARHFAGVTRHPGKAALLMLLPVLCLFLVACAGSPSESDGGDDNRPVRLIWWTYGLGGVPADFEEVLEAANRYSAEKIGVTVDLRLKTKQQIDLAMKSGEYYDMVFSSSWANDFDQNAREGLFYDITDIVREETPALWEAVDPWWNTTEFGGRIYGIPALKDMGIQVFFRMNSDYFEGEKGMTIPGSMSFEELEPYLAAYKEDYPDRYPLFTDYYGLEGFRQSNQNIVSSYIVIPYETEEPTKVIPIWEDEAYMSKLRCLHRWYELGYINPDAATCDITSLVYGAPVCSGTAWTGYQGWSDPEVYGFNVKLSQYMGPYMSRASMQGADFGINAGASEDRVRAVLRYFELLYTDRHFRDILAYGIEGKHFVYLDNGTATRTETGGTNYSLATFTTGPAVSATVLSASEKLKGDPDQWEKVYAEYEHAKVSATGSFSYDASKYENAIAAMDAVYSEHLNELRTGTVDPDETMAGMEEIFSKMGFYEVLQDAQTQLDEYLKTQ